jgi:uncharacterized membrane protein
MKILSTIEDHISVKSVSIFVIWLFQLSAIIGISLGHYHWFISKTPLNLAITAILVAVNFPIDTNRKFRVVALVVVLSLLIEWVGVHFGFLFGVYQYGENLGPKIDGVPWLIGVNWAVLILTTAAIADRLVKPLYTKMLIGALLMVFIDFFIEVSAPPFNFWMWGLGEAPLRNYVAWFGISGVLHAVYHKTKMRGDFSFSCNVYIAQLLFFVYFYGYHLSK